MEKGDVARVNAALQALHPVVLLDVASDHALLRRYQRPFWAGKHWLEVGRAKVGPDHTASLFGRVRGDFHLLFEIGLWRLVGHIDAGTGRIELPAVIHAAETGLLIPPEE